jgi:hypothetical protein
MNDKLTLGVFTKLTGTNDHLELLDWTTLKFFMIVYGLMTSRGQSLEVLRRNVTSIGHLESGLAKNQNF